jgi:thiamine-phosphate pyrophosphorylase
MIQSNLIALPAGGLYAITDAGDDLPTAVERALHGGAVVVQYRDKGVDHARKHGEAGALLRLCRPRGVPLIVNDDVELAAAIGADGVHLGEHDAAIAEARARLGSDAIIGVSCYDSLERARHAVAAGADYIAFGAFFDSTTKPGARRATTQLLRAAQPFGLPLVAIGGITPDNAQPLIDAGADFVAVVSGVFAADDPAAAARRYADLFTQHRSGIHAQQS